MPILHNSIIAATTADDPVTRSLRLDDGNNSNLYRATGSTNTTWTVAMWVKRSRLSYLQYFFSWGGDGINFDSSDRISIWNGSAYRYTTALFRDTSSWYHITISCNAGTITIYVNGVAHALSSSVSYPAWGSVYFGRWSGNTSYNFDGYLADIYGIEGSALDHTSFTESNDYGGLIPKEYTGSFGTNGFHLKFDDSSDIGADDAGSNDFTPTNISSHDVMLDVPYPKNYATLNQVSDVVSSGSNTFSNGSLTLNPSNAYNKAASTIAVSSGKWYAEVRYDSAGNQMAGIGRVDCLENTTNYIGQSSSAFGYVIYRPSGNMYHNGSTTSIFSALSSGDILQIALDLDSNTVWWGLNGTWVGTVGSSGGTSITAAEYYFVQTYRNPCTWNFGQDNTFAGQFTGTPNNAEFAYEIPAGFRSLNSSNLDDPSAIPSENFGVALYNGNSSSNSITGLGFQPDVLWTKSRSTSGSSPKIFDSIRGVTKRLQPDQTAVEQTVSELTSFDSDGFTLGSDSGSNYSGRTYAAWNWKADQSDARTSYTVRVEDAGGDAWDSSGSFYDSSTYLPNVYMEILESRNGTLVSLGKVAVRSLDPDGNSMSNLSQQDYTLKCMNLNAIAVRWYYDTSGDGQEYDFPCSYNDLLNEQKITIQGGNWTTNNHSNDDGCTDYNYSAPTGWANGDSLKTATTSYNGTDTATLHASWESAPTEKYNAGAGFTIISYSGDSYSDGDTQTIDHSLGVPLEFVLAKNRTNTNSNTSGDWIVWHKDLPSSKFLKLNSNNTTRTTSYGDIITTSVSGSQHQVVVANDYDNSSGTAHWLNDGGYGSPEEYILYGWATTKGMCKVGSYEGNGSSDGPFIAMDFAPAFFLYTNIDSSEHWYITDNKRPSYNVSSRNAMFAGTANAESTESRYQMDFLSNGVKIRATHAKTNASNKTYLYLAMAESPFKYGNAK